MTINVSMMTNRELFTEYEDQKSPMRYMVLTEMAKRINRTMVLPDTVQIFKQYKLNGAGDQRR